MSGPLTQTELIFIGYGLINLLVISMFWHDKQAAKMNKSRIPEVNLLQVAFVGGSLGALLASRWFRHKTHKQPFRTYLLLISSFHIVCLTGLAVWMLVTRLKTY